MGDLIKRTAIILGCYEGITGKLSMILMNIAAMKKKSIYSACTYSKYIYKLAQYMTTLDKVGFYKH